MTTATNFLSAIPKGRLGYHFAVIRYTTNLSSHANLTVAVRRAVLRWKLQVIDDAGITDAKITHPTIRYGSVGAWVPATMPSGLQHTHTRIGSDHHAVVTHCAGADRDKGPDVVVEGVHLGDLSGLEPIDVR
jgi:hypothetical protein